MSSSTFTIQEVDSAIRHIERLTEIAEQTDPEYRKIHEELRGRHNGLAVAGIVQTAVVQALLRACQTAVPSHVSIALGLERLARMFRTIA